MHAEDILAAVGKRPFEPFRLTLTEGTKYDIVHPELCMVGRRSVIIGLKSNLRTEPVYDRTVTVDILHIVQIEPLDNSPTHPGNGQGKS